MVTALHDFTSTQINRYSTNCTEAEGQHTLNCRPFLVIYHSTKNLILFGLFAHENAIIVIRKSDKRLQQLYLKATAPQPTEESPTEAKFKKF